MRSFARRLLLAAPVCAALACGPAMERTQGRKQAEIESFLAAHVVSVSTSGARALFVTDGELGVNGATGGWQRNFSLGQGEGFLAQPDHHGSMAFQFVDVSTAGVTLRYTLKSDHRSFGKNRISVDEGRVELPFKR